MADVPPCADSGAAGTEFQTIEALRQLGHEVNAVWAQDLSHIIKHGNLHSLIEQPLSYRKQMLKRLSVKDYDVVHVNQPHGYLAARTLKRLNRKCIFIHRSHGFETRVERDLEHWKEMYDLDERSRVRKMLSKITSFLLAYHSRAITRYADGRIVSSSQCADFLSNVMSVPHGWIAVIPQAPPAAFISRPRDLMTPDRLKRILYVGQFAFVKAPMIVAAVFNKLATMACDIEFTWVCAKNHHSDVTRLLSPTARTKTCLVDWMSQQSLIDIYDRHGIFVFPSFFEGFGKVFLEAMSRGLCVIAADNGGSHDVISSGNNGILVPTGNVKAMADSCLALLGNIDMAETMSFNASAAAREYTWERVAKETVAFYRNRLTDKFGPGY
jgi:glycosyltransferase involved in cell wall biosynthesis